MSLFFRLPSRMEDLSLFTRHLSGAMAARAPLPDILRAYAAEAEAGKFARAVFTLADRAEQGVELSAAMEEFDEFFPSAYRRLVRLGEQGRTLGGVMAQLADSLDEGLKVFENIRRAAIYPLLILVALFLNVGFLSVTVIPKLTSISMSMGGDLGVGNMFLAGGFPAGFPLFMLALMFPIAFLIAAMWGLRLRGFGYGRWQLSLPLVGAVLRRAETSRFAGNLALLLENRIPLAEALSLIAESSENDYVRAATEDLKERYESGERLGDLLSEQPLFPPSMAVMVASAEDHGGLAQTLKALSKHYADRTSHGLMVLREVFEPMLLLLIGILIALIMVSIYGPIFELPGLVF